jgi:hypothetical protein
MSSNGDADDLLKDFRATSTEHERDAGAAPAMLRLNLLKPEGKPKPRERWAFPYPLLKRVELDNPSKLILVFEGVTVTITGPRMDELFDQVAQHKTAVISVVNQAARKSSTSLPITDVDSIDVDMRPKQAVNPNDSQAPDGE